MSPFDPVDFARTEWKILVASKTFKGLVAMELAAVSLFVEQVANGTQTLDLYSLKGWLAVQAALVAAFLLRQSLAGLETQMEGKVPPVIVKAIEKAAEDKMLAKVDALAVDHPEAAAAFKASLAVPPAGGTNP